jgi:hypothetical protein
MSNDGFYVHGPDQHKLEHQAAPCDNLAVRVSIMTAILATFGAVFSYLGSSQQLKATDLKNKSILAKNESTQLRTQAANQWAFYQAKSTKQNLAELAEVLTQIRPLKLNIRRKPVVTKRKKRRSNWKRRRSKSWPTLLTQRSVRS